MRPSIMMWKPWRLILKVAAAAAAAGTLFSPQTIWGGGANSILFMFYRQAGTLQKTLDVFPQAMAYYYRLVQNHGAGSEYVLASEAYFQRGYWEKAFILATEALNVSRRNEQVSVELCAEFIALRISIALGNKNVSVRSADGWILCRRQCRSIYTAKLSKPAAPGSICSWG